MDFAFLDSSERLERKGKNKRSFARLITYDQKVYIVSSPYQNV